MVLDRWYARFRDPRGSTNYNWGSRRVHNAASFPVDGFVVERLPPFSMSVSTGQMEERAGAVGLHVSALSEPTKHLQLTFQREMLGRRILSMVRRRQRNLIRVVITNTQKPDLASVPTAARSVSASPVATKENRKPLQAIADTRFQRYIYTYRLRKYFGNPSPQAPILRVT